MFAPSFAQVATYKMITKAAKQKPIAILRERSAFFRFASISVSISGFSLTFAILRKQPAKRWKRNFQN